MTHPTTSRDRSRQRGFTLIELLIVMVIMAIIVALIASVGKYISEESARKRTQNAQALVKAAITAYEEEYRAYPPQGSTVELVDHLKKSKAAAELLQKIEQGLLVENKDGDLTLRDGWDKEMEYDRTGGSGGTPVILSGGPDGKIGDENAKDDVRSDFR